MNDARLMLKLIAIIVNKKLLKMLLNFLFDNNLITKPDPNELSVLFSVVVHNVVSAVALSLIGLQQLACRMSCCISGRGILSI